MNILSRKLNVLILVLGVALVGCSGNTGNTNTAPATNGSSANSTVGANNSSDTAARTEYPQAVKDEFLRSCESAGSNAKFCACMLDKIRAKYSFEEFSVIESEISAGTPPDEFVEFSGKARAECMR